MAYIINNDKAVLLHDPGVGKTPPVCVYIYNALKKNKEGCVWAMPKSLFEKNMREVLEFTPLKESDIIIVDGPKDKRYQLMNQGTKLYITSFTWFGREWQTFPENCKTIIVDEFHMGYANAESQRGAEFMRAMRTRYKKMIIMTGSIIDGKLSTAYPIINIMAPHVYMGLRHFMAEHGKYNCIGDFIGWTGHEKVARILKKYCRRRTFEEQFGKANKVILPLVRCTMGERLTKAYREMEEEAILLLPDGSYIDGETEGVNLLRCRQIVSCPHLFKILPEATLSGKEKILKVMLEERKFRGEKTILFGVFDPEVKRTYELCKKWGYEVEYINGTVPAEERARRSRDFETGKLDIIIGTPGTAAVGYNWAVASDVIFLSFDYKDTNFSQAYKRALRGKREHTLKVWAFSYGTKVESHLVAIIKRKSATANKVDSSYEIISLKG